LDENEILEREFLAELKALQFDFALTLEKAYVFRGRRFLHLSHS
jgi:hypothetical protein